MIFNCQKSKKEIEGKAGGAGLAVGWFAFLFGAHLLLQLELHLTLQSQL